MTQQEKEFARTMLEAAMEFGDEDSQASRDVIAVLYPLSRGDVSAAREEVRTMIKEGTCREFKQEF